MSDKPLSAVEGIKAPSRLRWHLEVDPLEF